MNKQFKRYGAALGLAGLAGASQAAAVDVAALTADIGSQAASVAAVGIAVLLIYGGVKAFKFVRAAMS